jgi:oligoendopeptidase F
MTPEELIVEVKALRAEVEALKTRKRHRREPTPEQILAKIKPMTEEQWAKITSLGKSNFTDGSVNKHKYLAEGEIKSWPSGDE